MSEGEGGSESTQQDPQDSVWQPGGGAGPRLLTSSQAEGEGQREGERGRLHTQLPLYSVHAAQPGDAVCVRGVSVILYKLQPQK